MKEIIVEVLMMAIYDRYHKDVATPYLLGFPVNIYAPLILIMARPSSVEVGGITW
ncbi:hypothetical protein [Nitrosomonas sp.]|uniref:hypothetical protein n=1 Tax=Nitrosomonas sp. TaxID=42353 RepID=UPI0025DEF061|nr:hypothetical protein [Nitrosomonas sp.]